MRSTALVIANLVLVSLSCFSEPPRDDGSGPDAGAPASGAGGSGGSPGRSPAAPDGPRAIADAGSSGGSTGSPDAGAGGADGPRVGGGDAAIEGPPRPATDGSRPGDAPVTGPPDARLADAPAADPPAAPDAATAAPDTAAPPPPDGPPPAPDAPQLLGAGQPCGAAGSCASGYCVDGVCCDGACAGSCVQCNAAGRAGTCVPIAAGQPPAPGRAACGAEALTTCGRTGACDGTGKCALYAAGTVCRSPACTAGRATGEARCDGAGTCQIPPAADCRPYRCDAAGTACASACATDNDCDGAPCVASRCGKVPNGNACNRPEDCATGFCSAEGVCCNRDCSAPCEACDLAGSRGSCTQVASGQPRGNKPACGGTGECAGACAPGNAQCTFPTATCTLPNAQGTCSAGTCSSPMCSSGYGDCTATAGCETNLMTSGDHCGTCGRSCLGGACEGGKCKVLEIASHARGWNWGARLAVEGSHVYWTRAPDPASKAQLVARVGKDGTGLTNIQTDDIGRTGSGENKIAADGTSVYWKADLASEVRACLLPTCAGGQMTLATNQKGDGAVFMDPTRSTVYWINYDSDTGTGSVMRNPASPVPVVSRTTRIKGAASDGTSVYFESGGQVLKVPATGGTPVPVGAIPTTFGHMAVNSRDLFFDGKLTDGGKRWAAVYRVPLNGTASPAPVTSYRLIEDAVIAGIAADETHVFALVNDYVTANTAHVMRCPVGGCAQALDLANVGGYADAFGPEIDAQYVYWITISETLGLKIFRAPK